jgi:signal peptidase I
MAGWMRDILETVLPAFLIVLVVNVFLAQATRVEGQSMEPNLHNDQRLVIEKVSYHFHPPRRGDIIVIKLPSRHSDPPLIKRVVGLPGETIEVRDGHVYVDGHVLEESYLNQLTFGDQPPHTISSGHVFVLGDNRGASNDSRAFGEVALSDIVGRAWLRYWPPDQAGLVR